MEASGAENVQEEKQDEMGPETSEENLEPAELSTKQSEEGDLPEKSQENGGDSAKETEKEDTGFKLPVLNKKLPTKTVQPPSQDAGRKSEENTPKSTKPRVVKTAGPSPAEKLKQSQIPIPYKEPEWGGLCDQKYSFEVLKKGVIIDDVDLTTKSFYVFGRLPSCDVNMEHPSLSRYHAVVQHRSTPDEKQTVGWYLYDLDSTHGTWVNKVKVKPNVFYRLKVGHVIKFGGSTRLHILQGPEDDREEESKLSVTEMKEMREKQKKEAEILQADRAKETDQDEEEAATSDSGCSWGMGDDADPVPDMDENPFALNEPENEDLYIDDPKKALKGYFEREGYDLPEYTFEELGFGKHLCRVEIPLDESPGQPLVAETTVTGKKREAVVACALEACRILDKMGLLRKAQQESRKRKAKDWEENDFYDSDEDTFLDRTGLIEQKRKQRMKRFGKMTEKAETYESLVQKAESMKKEMSEIEEKLEKGRADQADLQSDDVDALDAFMKSIKSGAMDTKTRIKLKRELLDLQKELKRVEKLMTIAKPNLPQLTSPGDPLPVTKKALPMFGKIRGHVKTAKPTTPTVHKIPVPVQESGDVEEEEEDEEENEETKSNHKKESAENEEKNDSEKEAFAKRTLPMESEVIEARTVDKSAAETDTERSVAENMKSSDQSDCAQTPETSKVEPQPPPTPNEETPPAKRKKSKPKIRKKEEMAAADIEYNTNDPDYAVWMPPAGQSGDGKTHLNAKFGY